MPLVPCNDLVFVFPTGKLFLSTYMTVFSDSKCQFCSTFTYIPNPTGNSAKCHVVTSLLFFRFFKGNVLKCSCPKHYTSTESSQYYNAGPRILCPSSPEISRRQATLQLSCCIYSQNNDTEPVITVFCGEAELTSRNAYGIGNEVELHWELCNSLL